MTADRRSGLLLAAALLPVAVVVVGGIGSTLLQSLGLLPVVGPARLSLDAYTAGGSDLLVSLGVSLAIATAATVIAVVLGASAALLVVSGGRWGRAVAGVSAATVTVPHLVGAAMIGLLIADSGVLPRLLGIPADAWPTLVGGPWWAAVIAEYAWKESAFIGLVVAGTLATRVARFDETASMLGAGRRARLRLVFVPLALPSLVVSAAITFAYTLGSYEVAALLGRTYPEPLSVMALRLFTDVSLTARPEAAAVAMVTVAASAFVALGAFAMLRRSAVWR